MELMKHYKSLEAEALINTDSCVQFRETCALSWSFCIILSTLTKGHFLCVCIKSYLMFITRSDKNCVTEVTFSVVINTAVYSRVSVCRRAGLCASV